jgi:hypothetical protein
VDRKELEQVKTEKAHLTAQVASMARELSQKNDEIRKYHAEQTVVFNQIRELVGNPAEIVNKAHLYDWMMASGALAFAKQVLPILVKLHPDDEGPFGGNPEGGSTRRHAPASTLSGSPGITNRNLLRSGGRSRVGPKPSDDCRNQSAGGQHPTS